MVGAPGTFSGVASGSVVLDGTLIVGAGIGTRTRTGSSPGDFTANTPSAVVALCVPGTPGCALPTIEPGLGTVVEGDNGTTTLEVPVSLSRPIGDTVTVDWTTIASQATAPADFVAASGTVTFEPTETAKTVSITVNGDENVEPDETLLVSFRDPQGAERSGFYGLGYGVIVDDEPGVKVVPGFGSTEEGDNGTTTLDVPVTLSAPAPTTVTVDWALRAVTASSPADFAAAEGTLAFAPGETQKIVSVTVNGDEVAEGNEYFTVALENAADARLGGWNGMGFGRIDDDDG
jgi:hypothetical protein